MGGRREGRVGDDLDVLAFCGRELDGLADYAFRGWTELLTCSKVGIGELSGRKELVEIVLLRDRPKSSGDLGRVLQDSLGQRGPTAVVQ